MRILDGIKLDFDDLLLVPQRSDLSSRAEVDLLREYKFRHCKIPLKCTGIIASNMYNTGTKNMAYSLANFNCLTTLHKYHELKDLKNIFEDPILDGRIFVTIGESDKDLDFLRKLQALTSIDMNRLMVCVDVANAYRSSFIDFIKRIRDFCCEQTLLMAGNVTTPNLVEELILAGVDIVKIFIGPGSQCITRNLTGVGYPSFSATVECSNAAHGLGGMVCCDGGMKKPADIVKAFASGSDFVMIGGLLAGTEQCEGEWEEKIDYNKLTKCNLCGDGKNKYIPSSILPFSCSCCLHPYQNSKYLKFFGMSSYEAMEKFGGKEKDYRASEGKCELIPYKGDASLVMKEILGGLRSAATYLGCSRLKDFPKVANFVRLK